MPIIVDPRQNPHVEQFHGIIEVDNVLAYYVKENKGNKKRAMPWGFYIERDDINLVPHDDSGIEWNGKPITHRAEFDENAINLGKQGPVTKRIFTFLNNKNNWPKHGEEDWTSEVPD